jgi:UDP-glucose 4-epimerase
MSMKKKAVVTGGAGFIGSHLVEALDAEGWAITVVDDLSASGNWGKIPHAVRERVKLVESPCNDFALMRCELSDGDCLFHLAAVSSVIGAQKDPARSVYSGEMALLTCARAAVEAGCRHIVYASSAAVYGDPVSLPIDENHPCEPLSIYGAGKLSCERYLRYFARGHGIKVSCLRFFNVYGPRQDPSNPYSGVISKFMEAAARGVPLEVTGDGEQTRDFIHVQDVARACLRMAGLPDIQERSDHEVFNIGAGSAVTINDLAATIGALAGTAFAIRHVESRTGEIRHSVCDAGKALRIAGFRCSVPLSEGLEALLAVGKP